MIAFQQVFEKSPHLQCLINTEGEILAFSEKLKNLLGEPLPQTLQAILPANTTKIPYDFEIPWHTEINSATYKGKAELQFFIIAEGQILVQIQPKSANPNEVNLLIARISVLVKEIGSYLPIPLIILDLVQQRAIYSNHQVERLLGYSTAEYQSLGNDIGFVLTHPEDRQTLMATRDSFREANQRFMKTMKLRLLHKEGEYKWLKFYLNNIGNIPEVFRRFLLVSAIDINPEKQTEVQLSSENEKLNRRNERNILIMGKLVEKSRLLKGIADTMPASLSAYDTKHHTYLFNNYQLASMLGYSHREYQALQDPVAELIAPEDKQVMQQARNRVTNANQLVTQECRLRHKKGHYVHFVTSIKRIPHTDIVVSIFYEIEEIKQNQKRILEYQHFISELVESSPAIVHIFDEIKYEVIYYNRQITDILGYGKEEFDYISKNMFDYIHPEDQAIVLDNKIKIRKTHDESKIFRFEYRLKNSKGGWTWVATQEKVFKRDESGKVIQSVGSTVSVDRIKQHEARLTKLNAQLIQRNQTLTAQEEELRTNQEELEQILEELEHRNFELDQIVYKISHDLRSPLSTILGLVNVMKDTQAIEEMQQYIQYIESRITKLDGFIRDMLSYAKTTRQVMESELIDLKFMIEDCLIDLEQMPGYSKVKVELEIEDNGVKFYSDALRLQVVLSNIISNAIKYYNPHQELSFLKILVNIDEEKAQFAFIDNGIGIEEELLAKVFDMFFRATDSAEGSGLGMYIVKQTIDKMKGSIEVKSKFGEGSEFQVILPNNLNLVTP